MVTRAIAAYLDFVHSPLGGALVVTLSLAICAAVVAWAWRGSRWERVPALVAAGVLTTLTAVIYAFAIRAGWWGGMYFQTPLVVQAAMLLPLSVIGWVAWLTGYGWLASHSRHPLLIYVLIALLVIPLAIVADRANISRGLFLVAADGELWIDALVGVGIVLTPVLLFEGIRRGLASDALP